MPIRIYIAISSHGYGHVTQTCLVLNALFASCKDIEFTIATAVSRDFVAARLHSRFEYLPERVDPGLVMESSLRVLPKASFDTYTQWFSNWDTRVAALAAYLKQQRFTLALSNVAFTVAPAAKQIGIPAIGLCSLNWADLFAHYCGQFPGAKPLIHQLQNAYADFARFLRLMPAMPMPWLHNTVSTPPVARIGINQRQRILDALNIDIPETKLVLVGFGGIETPLPLTRWPAVENVLWLIATPEIPPRDDMSTLHDLDLSFIDAIASCDAVVTKAGYGTFVEAAFAAKPVIYVERGDWPEEPYLAEWLAQYVPTQRIGQQSFENGDFLREMDTVLHAPAKKIRPEQGGKQAVEEILRFL